MTGGVADVRIDWPALVAAGERQLLLHCGCTPEEVAVRCRGQLVYLATPYSREAVKAGVWDYQRSVVMQTRAAEAALDLCRAGVTAISPIVLSAEMCHVAHGHGLATVRGLHASPDPLDAAFWDGWCRPLLYAAGAVAVPDIDGWDSSLGVWREASWAVAHGVPVFLYGGAGG